MICREPFNHKNGIFCKTSTINMNQKNGKSIAYYDFENAKKKHCNEKPVPKPFEIHLDNVQDFYLGHLFVDLKQQQHSKSQPI